MAFRIVMSKYSNLTTLARNIRRIRARNLNDKFPEALLLVEVGGAPMIPSSSFRQGPADI